MRGTLSIMLERDDLLGAVRVGEYAAFGDTARNDGFSVERTVDEAIENFRYVPKRDYHRFEKRTFNVKLRCASLFLRPA